MAHIGIEVHAEESQICILAEGGRVARAPDPGRLAEVLGEHAPGSIPP